MVIAVKSAQHNNQKTLMNEYQSHANPKKEGNMAFYAVDVRDRVIQRVTQQYNGADNTRYFLIEAGSAKLAWAKAVRASDAISHAGCDSCHHRYCSICEDCSLTQQYSDYWICHSCGALNPRNCV
jgi:hypothetical protein